MLSRNEHVITRCFSMTYNSLITNRDLVFEWKSIHSIFSKLLTNSFNFTQFWRYIHYYDYCAFPLSFDIEHFQNLTFIHQNIQQKHYSKSIKLDGVTILINFSKETTENKTLNRNLISWKSIFLYKPNHNKKSLTRKLQHSQQNSFKNYNISK